MFEYRQVMTRMRLGDTDRAIARVGLMGRRKVAQLRRTAEAAGWLDVATPLPGDPELAVHLGSVRTQPAVASLAEPHRERITRWWRQGVQGTTIHGALVRSHGFTGSYSSVRRFLAGIEAAHPQVTTVLEFDPGEAAQVDFGRGHEVLGPRTGELLGTWIFIMTLAWSRHAYAEVVTDQKVATWLGCHRRAFEWFNGVPRRLTIDNPKCAITRACYHDPEVQRAYAECAEGYGFKIEPCPPRDPKKKGRVESAVKYVKRSFVPLREFRDLVDANAQLRAWLLGPAGNRVHGTTHEQPLTRFVETEREFLRPLPTRPPELAVWARVKLHPDCHVQFEKTYYSAAFTLVRQRLRNCAYEPALPPRAQRTQRRGRRPHRRAPPRPRHRLRQPILRSNPTTLPKSRTTAPRRIPLQRRTARTLRTSQLAILNRLPHPPDHRHQRNVGACAPRNPRCPCSPTNPEQCDQSSLARTEIIRKIPHGFT